MGVMRALALKQLLKFAVKCCSRLLVYSEIAWCRVSCDLQSRLLSDHTDSEAIQNTCVCLIESVWRFSFLKFQFVFRLSCADVAS